MRLQFHLLLSLLLSVLLASQPDTQLDYVLDTIRDWSEAFGEIGALVFFAALGATAGPGGIAGSASDFEDLKRTIKQHVEFEVDFIQTDILLKGI